MKQSTKEILCEAKRLLIKNGWQQYDIGVNGGPMCLAGAVNMAKHGSTSYPGQRSRDIDIDASGPKSKAYINFYDSDHPAFRALYNATGVSSLTGLCIYNNDCDRTKKDILEALDRAIELS